MTAFVDGTEDAAEGSCLPALDSRHGVKDAVQGGFVLRRTLRQHASGVTVITVTGPTGFTATSFSSVSLDPPLVSFCLGLRASALPAVHAANRFAVHVLGGGDVALARVFAQSGIDRFAGVSWRAEEDGLPLLAGVPAWLAARVTLRQRIGDHLLVVGEVEQGGGDCRGPALVHYDGRFVPLGKSSTDY